MAIFPGGGGGVDIKPSQILYTILDVIFPFKIKKINMSVGTQLWYVVIFEKVQIV